MKFGVIASLIIGLGWVALALVQLWFAPLDNELFFKLSITAGVLLVAVVLATLAIREYLSEKKLKQDGFIDG